MQPCHLLWPSSLLICALLSYFVVMRGTLRKWDAGTRVQTVVDNTALPVQNVPFPAVTVCPGPNFIPKRFYLQERLYNMLKFECLEGEEGCVREASPLREEFGPLFLEPLEEEIKKNIRVEAEDEEFYLQEKDGLTKENGDKLERLPAHRAFWFGWFAAFPDTKLVK